jgi:hypothetical protein
MFPLGIMQVRLESISAVIRAEPCGGRTDQRASQRLNHRVVNRPPRLCGATKATPAIMARRFLDGLGVV